jgi:heat shock protein HtpX
VAIVSDMMMRSAIFGHNDNENRGGGILSIIGIVLAILAPIIASLMQFAISRKREYLADASASLLTRYPEGLASALEKLQNYSRPMRNQSSAIAHLYISNPLGTGKFARKAMNLFSTHPPLEDRIKILRSM